MKCSLGISNFLEEISSLSHSIVFLYFFALITEEGFLISLCFSLELCIQMLISFLFSFAFHFSFHSYFKASSDNHFAFLHFFFLGMVLLPVSCTMSQTSIHSSSGTLSDLIPYIYLSLPLYNHKGFDLAPSLVYAADCIEVSIFGCKDYNQSDFGVDHLVMSTCRVFSCVVGRGCLLWPVHSLGKILLAFALLHFVLEGQICLLLQVFLDFLLLHSSPL